MESWKPPFPCGEPWHLAWLQPSLFKSGITSRRKKTELGAIAGWAGAGFGGSAPRAEPKSTTMRPSTTRDTALE